MATNFHVATTHRVSITVPDYVWDFIFRNRMEREWDMDVMRATEGNVGAGQNSYSDVEQWADFHTMSEANACGWRLAAVLAKYTELADNEEQSE